MENLPRPAAILAAIITALLGIAWGFAEFDLIPIDANIFEPILTVFGALTAVATVLAFSVNKSDEKQQRSNREILIATVQNNWIEGVLHDALRDAEIQVEFEGAAEKAGDAALYRDYELPIDLVLNDGSTRENLKRSADVLLKTFKHVDRKLLILGAPGSGKTVLMLQLAERLLQEARDDEKKSIPVVFNLSSWAEKRESLTDWLVEQLRRDYGARKKIATELIQSDSFIYLLDGFDEMSATLSTECLTQLNKFITPTRQVVICSRKTEYSAMNDHLNTRFAIELLPLRNKKFRLELSKRIPDKETTHSIIRTLRNDAEVWEEVKKPLFMNILINTYADGKPFAAHNIEGTTIEKLQKLAIEPYIKRQLQNKRNAKIDNALILRYLAFISHNLHERGRTIFYLELIDPTWFPTRKLYIRFYLIYILFYGIFSGIWLTILDELTGKFFGHIIEDISTGYLRGIAGWVLLSLVLAIGSGIILWIALDEQNDFSLLPGIRYKLYPVLISTSLWVIIGLVTAVFGWSQNMGIAEALNQLQAAIESIPFISLSISSTSWISGSVSNKLLNWLGVGLLGGVTTGLVGGLVSDIYQIDKFNQGFRKFNLLGVFLSVYFGLNIGLGSWLLFGIDIAIIFALFAGLFGLLIIQQINIIRVILRMMLINRSLAPRRFDTFLEQMIEQRIMRQVGGSAIFIHRYILEYFADEWERRYASEFEE